MDRQRRDLLRQLGLLTAAASTAAVFQPRRVAAQTPGLTRSRPGPLPKIVKTPAELVASKLVLPFSKSVALRPDRLGSYKFTPNAYESVGLTPFIGATGERQEIGLVTEAIAQWMAGESPNNMLVQAEAHGSIPVHALDKDGFIYSAIKYPRASFDYRGGDPKIDPSGYPVAPECAHYPALCYVPFLATGDRYYLEELQFAAAFNIMWGPPDYRGLDKALLNEGQPRGWAWALRDVASCYLATPDTVTAPLLPKAYWKQVLDNNRDAFLARWVKNKNPFVQNTRVAIGFEPWVAPWEQDYLGFVFGWMIWTGQFADWRPLYEWHMGQAIIRATGPLRSQALNYHLMTDMKPPPTDYPSLLKANNKAPTSSGNFPPDVMGGTPHYAGFLRGNLKLAVLNGVAGAPEAFAYVDAQTKKGNYIPMRWAV